jgi:hypothetical protein
LKRNRRVSKIGSGFHRRKGGGTLNYPAGEYDYPRHPDFGGSISIKAILPVLFSDLSYKDLNVQNGGAAQAAWEQLLAEEDKSKRLELAQGLKAYCHMDTLAMVRLYQYLAERVSVQGFP